MGPTILLIDDQPNNIKVLLSFLKNHNFQTRVADSGERALQILDRFLPDLILLDVMMSGLDGFETCRRIKAKEKQTNIPVIFMTALDNLEDKMAGFEAGGVDYITKPFHQAEVLARINTHIELRKKNIALQESENRIRLILESAPISIHEIDLDGNLISMNAAGLKMMGVASEKQIRATSYNQVVDDTDLERVSNIFKKACAGRICNFEFKGSRPGDHVYSARLVPIKNKQDVVERLLGTFEDITEQKKAQEKIRQMAFYDALTQLPNRRLLEDRFEQIRTQSERTKNCNAFIFMDLDNFKPLNDTHGHKAGDLLLVSVADRLTGSVRAMDTVARLGGDEFVVLLNGLHQEKEQAVQQAANVAEKIRSAIAAPYVLILEADGGMASQVQHNCTASIGVVVFSGHKIIGYDEILKWADKAMYNAKETGKNKIAFLDIS